MAKQDKVLYDGECNFCKTWVSRVEKKDTNKIFEFIPYQLYIKNAGFSDMELAKQLHVITSDEVFTGGRAILYLLAKIGYKFPDYILRVPALVFVVELGYRVTAKLRHRRCGNKCG